ncbi:MAG: isoprenylcysteine carboxylmethyltransferase family protein [Anaerolineales bacterium]
MKLFSTLLSIISIVWIAFEIFLIVRDRRQGKGKTVSDRGTRYYNFIAIALGIAIASVLQGNSKFFFLSRWSDIVFWIGLCIMLLGFGLRIWAVIILGASFRTTVETHTDQQVVRSGPYRLVRHPSYGGLILMCCGYGIAVQNWLSLAFAVILPLVALLYRISIEEAVLVSSLGSDYEKYQRKTKKLVPWIW